MRTPIAIATVLAWTLPGIAACYKPAPPNGALLCSTDGQCPEGYRCAGDGSCWRNGEDPDGAPDAAMPFTQPPPPISPRNGASTGSARAALARRPLFRWRALPEATSYEIQIDDSCDAAAFRTCTFPSPEANETTSRTSLRVSAGLNVATSAPAGRRYYWRVRGCGDSQCTPWSEVRYLDVGRNATDFNGDGDTDLVIGNANAPVNGNSSVGSTYISPASGYPLFQFPTLTPPGLASGDNYGFATASAGDVDGDGYADLVVASMLVNESGRVYLYRGGAGWLTDAPAQTLLNPEGQTEALFGHALAGGDLNGDGHSDLAIGAEIQDGAAVSDGKVFIYAGESSVNGLPAHPTWTLENPAHQEYGYFGSALAIGDFDGDGYADLAVGAYQQDAVGRVYLYRGGPGGVAQSPSAALDDPVIVTNAAFGSSLASGDFDGDGHADLAVGAPGEQVGGVPAVGHVYIFRGGPRGIANRVAPWRTLHNPTGQTPSLYGSPLAAADFNADDTDDLAVSATYQDMSAGRVYIYQGAPAGLPSEPSKTLSDPTPVDSRDVFGCVLATGDHVPADGFVDLFVGSHRDNGTIYVFDGAAGGLPATTANIIWGGPGVNLGPSSLSSAPP
jgi:hypothetical protein